MRLNTNEMAMVDVALPILPACTPTVPPIETTSSPLSPGPRRNAGANIPAMSRPNTFVKFSATRARTSAGVACPDEGVPAALSRIESAYAYAIDPPCSSRWAVVGAWARAYRSHGASSTSSVAPNNSASRHRRWFSRYSTPAAINAMPVDRTSIAAAAIAAPRMMSRRRG